LAGWTQKNCNNFITVKKKNPKKNLQQFYYCKNKISKLPMMMMMMMMMRRRRRGRKLFLLEAWIQVFHGFSGPEIGHPSLHALGIVILVRERIIFQSQSISKARGEGREQSDQIKP
jgi:hypothetical protein